MNNQFNQDYNYNNQEAQDLNSSINHETNQTLPQNNLNEKNKKPLNPKKELKNYISKNKEFNKILKMIKKNLDSLEKWKQSYKKTKANKDDFVNCDALFSNISNLINNLREEKYNFESQILENNKKIDELKDKIKK